ncbi:MAG: SGNH/GDSL hydrolase family protein [Planctomycetota bacterium]
MNTRPRIVKALLLVAGWLLALDVFQMGVVRLVPSLGSEDKFAGGVFAPHEDPILHYKYRPGAVVFGQRINSLGFRDKEFKVAKEPGTLRLVMVGDSVVAGERGPVDHTFPRKLGAILTTLNDRPVEVINAGLSGTNTLQQSVIVRDLALPLEPDIVLHMFTGNDTLRSDRETVGSTSVDNSQLMREAWLKRLREREASGTGHLSIPGKEFLRRHSRLYGHVSTLWDKSLVKVGLRPGRNRTDEVEGYRKNLADLGDPTTDMHRYIVGSFRAMNEECRSRGVKFGVILLPERVHYYDPAYPRPHATMVRDLEALGIPALNLLDPLEKVVRDISSSLPLGLSEDEARHRASDRLFVDVVHFTPWGKEQAAPLVKKFVEDRFK